MIKNDYYITYNNGPKVEINGDTKKEYLVEFIDDFSKKIIHSSTIENNMWTACSREWFTNWVVKINGEIVDRFDLDGKKVRIILESKSMGDTIAWAPYAVEFANKHNCKVFLTTHHNEWFENLPIYKDIEFVGFGFNYPGMISTEGALFRPILEDDLFILQIFTMYGVIPISMFFYYLFLSKNNSHYMILNDKYWRSAKSIILCVIISAFHTNALVRPQIFPVFIFFIVIADQIANHYRYKFSLQSSLK